MSRYNVMKECFESIASYQSPQWQLIMDIISRYLMIINSSINIIIYCWGGKTFKSVLLAVVLRRELQPQQVTNICILKKLSPNLMLFFSFKVLRIQQETRIIVVNSVSRHPKWNKMVLEKWIFFRTFQPRLLRHMCKLLSVVIF